MVYKPAENGSIYASYATSATPPGNTLGEGSEGNPLGGTPDRNGNLLKSDMEPETTKNYEIGTKWDLLNDQPVADRRHLPHRERKRARSSQHHHL